ncbi:hypothetical protein EVAR_47233_1 [Eumeta japonica]|uniref:Uncharacterized protein n=1 Tax=Eumeta variegata TaxID=151549 RepID=A0A4C1XQ52_EUMVA|nr:hypothetical protein EVAR_47233_1 [Eumeta japonica]
MSTRFIRFLSLRKLWESKKTDLFYHLLRNASLPFLNHAGAQDSELSAARRRGLKYDFPAARTERVQRSRRVTNSRRRCPRPARRAGCDSVNSVNSVARQIVEQLIPCVVR